MRREISWSDSAPLLRDALAAGGAFVVAVDPNGKANPMTIGWGQVGVVWGLPVFTAYIRKSRYTYECVQASESFTVCVPRPGDLKDALLTCGTQSGRDIDKVAECGLDMSAGEYVQTPVIEGCALIYECRVVARTQQERVDFSAPDVLEGCYPDGDHHLAVFGKIVACYTTS